MVGVGNIVSVGGAGGSGGGGGTSGIQILNDQTGPTIVLVGTSGIVVAPVAPNIINIGFTGSIVQSGVVGVNGIDVQQVGGNFVIDGAGASGVSGGGSTSGLCYAADFTSITSSTITHNLGTTNVVVDVFDASDNKMLADRVGIVDINNVILEFNRPQTGKIVVMACGGNDTNTEECRRYALLVS